MAEAENQVPRLLLPGVKERLKTPLQKSFTTFSSATILYYNIDEKGIRSSLKMHWKENQGSNSIWMLIII